MHVYGEASYIISNLKRHVFGLVQSIFWNVYNIPNACDQNNQCACGLTITQLLNRSVKLLGLDRKESKAACIH